MTLLRMAESYYHSAGLLWQRIQELKEQSAAAAPAERWKLEQRIRELRIMYRETRETAQLLERYYDRKEGRRSVRRKI